MHCFVTGCAGFIGSNLVDRLLQDGHSVTGFDNLSTGQENFLAQARNCPVFRLVEGDLLDLPALESAMSGSKIDLVVHLAANADVRNGPDQPRKDLEQNTIGTFNVVEAARRAGVKRIAFSSTGSVYGEPDQFPTPETAKFPIQTSLYGASKVAGEGLLAAYAESFGMQAFIFRFVSILGERYSHGHVFDFCRLLKQDPSRMRVLGDGHQRKSYLYVQDCINAILIAVEKATDKVNIFNLGTDEYCEVNDSIGWITERLGVSPQLDYTGGTRGWTGDNPFIFLDCSKIRSLGWAPKLTIREGILRTVDYICENHWLLESRT